MNRSIEKCPVCSHDLTITKLYCELCGTTLSGQFGTTWSRFKKLTEDQMEFLLIFIKSEGKFNRMEEVMNLSYPTLRSRFNDILAAMGFEGDQSDEEHLPTKDERIEILQKLDDGKLDPAQAEVMLRSRGLKSFEDGEVKIG